MIMEAIGERRTLGRAPSLRAGEYFKWAGEFAGFASGWIHFMGVVNHADHGRREAALRAIQPSLSVVDGESAEDITIDLLVGIGQPELALKRVALALGPAFLNRRRRDFDSVSLYVSTARALAALGERNEAEAMAQTASELIDLWTNEGNARGMGNLRRKLEAAWPTA